MMQYKGSQMISVRATISKAQQVSVFQSMAAGEKMPDECREVGGDARIGIAVHW